MPRNSWLLFVENYHFKGSSFGAPSVNERVILISLEESQREMRRVALVMK